MGKGKLSKFADMAAFPNVIEYPYTFISDVPFPLRGCWNKDHFRNTNPITLELGCGRGEYTIGLAKLFPERNFIGVDIKGARMWTGARTAIEENLTNVAFLRTNIELIDRLFGNNEIDEIWLTFSDPQMKKVTKRLTSTYFLQRYRHILVDNGLVHLKTDSNFLFTYTSYVVQTNNLDLQLSSKDLYADIASEQLPKESLHALSICTYYEQQWLDRKIPIKYICFKLPAMGELYEPNVEIKTDEYRSYNRIQRSLSQTSR